MVVHYKIVINALRTMHSFYTHLIFEQKLMMDVFENLLNEANREGWSQLQTRGSGSQTLLYTAERYGRYLGSLLNETNGPLLLLRENIGESPKEEITVIASIKRAG